MTIKELFETIKARIDRLEHTDKTTQNTICEQYGEVLRDVYQKFKKGQQNAAIAFAAHWMPWMLVNRMVMADELRQMEIEDLDRLKVYIGGNRDFATGRRTVIDGNHKATDSVRVFAFGIAFVKVFDEATVHGYENTTIEIHSGWCHAFNECQVLLLGRGIVEGWDNSHVTVKGDALVYVNDSCTLSKLPNSAVLERK